MKSFPLLIKPASADCNLRCRYCFYLDRSSLYPETAKHRMSAATLERLIRTYMAIDQPQCAFIWQGGEPSLMGVEFFQRVVELQIKWGPSGASVANAFQTNATLINDKLARHLSEYNFLVGVSLDGPAHIHDRYRCHSTGAGSFSETMKGIAALKRNHVQFNILSLVTDVNATKGKEVYRYLRDNGFMYHQYIPCVEFKSDGGPETFSVRGEGWGDFLCEIFDEWISWDAGRVSVRFFDSVLSSLLNQPNNACHMGSDCCHYLLVEYNGDVYPCDFFVEPGYRLGNIMVDTWEELCRSEIYLDFGKLKSQKNEECQSCPYASLCGGDCPTHRFYGRRDPQQLSWLCSGYKQFFGHALSRLTSLADNIREGSLLTPIDQGDSKPPGRRPGRNEPCPCGSGRKYKKCCGS